MLKAEAIGKIFVNKTVCTENVYISPVRTRFWKIYCLIIFAIIVIKRIV